MKILVLLFFVAAAATMSKPVMADFSDVMLKEHNYFRAKHNANPLSIDPDVSCSSHLSTGMALKVDPRFCE